MFEPLTLAFQTDETKQHHEKDRPQLLRASSSMRRIALSRSATILTNIHQLWAFTNCGRNGDIAPLVPYCSLEEAPAVVAAVNLHRVKQRQPDNHDVIPSLEIPVARNPGRFKSKSLKVRPLTNFPRRRV
jgi:hypothetical protein